MPASAKSLDKLQDESLDKLQDGCCFRLLQDGCCFRLTMDSINSLPAETKTAWVTRKALSKDFGSFSSTIRAQVTATFDMIIIFDVLRVRADRSGRHMGINGGHLDNIQKVRSLSRCFRAC
jgi:hypothetical protein